VVRTDQPQHIEHLLEVRGQPVKPSSAYPSPEEFCYPVKRRGERRRLNPNRDGIAWLEEQSETDTEISMTYPTGEILRSEDGETYSDFLVHRALGYYSARQRDMYPWPMFQVHAGFKASMLSYSPCPGCDDWARTSRCTSHHDRDGVAGLKRGYRRRIQAPLIDGRAFFDQAVRASVYQRITAAPAGFTLSGIADS